MLIQNMKATLIGAYVLLMAYSSHAQIEKGATSLGGDINFITGQLKSPTNGVINSGHSLNLTPSYARFVTDNIMLKGRLSGLSANFDGKQFINSDLKQYSFSQNNQLANLELEARYYFNPKADWKFFGGAALGMTQGKLQTNYFTNGNLTNQNTLQISTPSYSLYGGVNKFLNKEIALEGRLSYSNTMEILPVRGLTYRNSVRNIGLNIGLNNFTNYRTADKDFSGLIDKGRKVVGANLEINSILPSNEYKQYRILGKVDLEYGQFVTKGLLLGAKANFSFESSYQMYNLTPYVQYFHPVSKRLLLHAKAESELSIINNIGGNKYFNPSIRGGLGATYFLSKHVAIDFDVLNFTKTFNNNLDNAKTRGLYFSPQVKLRFFF